MILSSEFKGIIYAVLSGLLYGFLGYFGMTIIASGFSISTMLFWRFLASSLLMILLFVSCAKKFVINKADALKTVLLGAGFYGSTSLIYFFASKYIGTGLAMVIFFTYPAMVMLLNWALYKNRITKNYLLSVIIIIVGMLLLVDMHEFKFDTLGIVLSLLSAFCYACYMVASKKINVPPLLSTLYVSIGCTLITFITALADQSFIIPATTPQWLNIVGMGIFCTALPILLLLESMKYMNATKASLLSVLEPLFVVIFGVILLGEKISFLQGIGISIILCGALMTLVGKDEKDQ